jgi:hypothetical protein
MEADSIQATIVTAGEESMDFWALVEIFGHTKVAGRVTTRKVGVNVMIQVDVPKGKTDFSHSQLFSPAAIFSINPTTETWCRRFAKQASEYGHSPLPYIPEERQIADAESETPEP